MKNIVFTTSLLISTILFGQRIDSLNTARNSSFMKEIEKEMIYEINLVRHNPTYYITLLEPKLKEAKETLKTYGKGEKNYSLTFSSTLENGNEIKTIDTTWNNANEEEVRALTTLIDDLKKLNPLSILKPDLGIYKAATKHTQDQNKHEWKLMHTGTDGSLPWDRINKFSPAMEFGNENIAGRYPEPTARIIVIQLLIDSGIPGYGHRYNLLDPQWTHVACVYGGLHESIYWWIQNFGKKKIK